MKKAPAMPLFGDAYLADTRHLSLEEHGAYLQLLMIAWRSDGCQLPNDDKRLAQMLGVTAKKWASLKPVVMSFWTLSDGGWEQKRLLKERRWVAKKSEDNRAAANARWNANSLENNEAGDANAMPKPCINDAPPPPPKKERTTDKSVVATQRGNRLPAGFEIPDDWIAWALAETGWSRSDAEAEGEAFIDYWHAKAGRDGVKLDWPATWRNWVRNSRRTTKARTYDRARITV